MLTLKVVYGCGHVLIVERPALTCLVDLALQMKAERVEVIHYQP
jgi:hypothetical protein